jgi:hypothetical protein
MSSENTLAREHSSSGWTDVSLCASNVLSKVVVPHLGKPATKKSSFTFPEPSPSWVLGEATRVSFVGREEATSSSFLTLKETVAFVGRVNATLSSFLPVNETASRTLRLCEKLEITPIETMQHNTARIAEHLIDEDDCWEVLMVFLFGNYEKKKASCPDRELTRRDIRAMMTMDGIRSLCFQIIKVAVLYFLQY